MLGRIVYRNREVGIMTRISLNGQKTQLSTKLMVPLDLWDTKGNRVSGKSHQARVINETLDEIKVSLTSHYCE